MNAPSSESACQVLFGDPDLSWNVARIVTTLQASGLTVEEADAVCRVRSEDGPVLLVSLADDVTAAAALDAIRERLPSQREALTTCDACIHIDVPDLDETLDEINTLIETQLTLQEATRGVLYVGWNQTLTGPD